MNSRISWYGHVKCESRILKIVLNVNPIEEDRAEGGSRRLG